VSWRPGPSKSQLIIFGSGSNEDSSLRSTQPGPIISCHLADRRYLPRARGSASLGVKTSRWKYLATIAWSDGPSPPLGVVASMSRSSKQTHESTEDVTSMEYLCAQSTNSSTSALGSLSFPDMHSFFRCIALSRGNSPFYSVPTRFDMDDGKKRFLSIARASQGPHKEPPSPNSSLHNLPRPNASRDSGVH
jgi:hypothetical protein